MNELKARRNYLRDENKKFAPTLREIMPHEFPPSFTALASAYSQQAPKRVWRSRNFLVQLFHDPCGFDRLSISRTELGSDGRLKDGITWDDLQRLKGEAGFGASWAVECYPPDQNVVNVANHRHLFLLTEPPAFGWK